MHPLAAKVAALHRRLVWRERAVASCSILAIVVAAVCGLGLADYLVRFTDRGLRVLVTAALAAITAWATYRWWFAARTRRGGPLAVARRVESQFPQLRDRLASALEFLGQEEHDPTAGSAALRRAVVADADLAVGALPIDSIIDRRPLRRAAMWAAIAVAIVAACLAIDAAAVGTAFVRLLAPLGATEWPRTNHLEFRDPPTHLAAGETFEAELVDRGGLLPDDVRIQYRFVRDGRNETQSEWMNRAGDIMVARREDVRQPFAFRAEGGDDHRMPWISVNVVEPPQLTSLAIVTHPPAYAGLPASAAEPQLDVLAGTGIEISGTSNEPLGAARVVVGDETIEAEIRPDAAGLERRAFYVPAEMFVAACSGTYRLELENREGVAGTGGQWNLRVEPDTPPSVSWQRPQADLFVLPTAIVPLAVAVKDNLAIARVVLRYTRTGKPEEEAESIELYRGPEEAADEPSPGPFLQARGNSGGESRVIEYSWSLESLDLPVGTQLTLRVRADDYRRGTSETATPRRVTIISRDELDARLADRQAQIARRLDEILTTQRNVREDVRGLDIQVRGAGRIEVAERNSLQAAELNQRRVGRRLTDSTEGVPALAEELVAELDMNGVTDSGVLAQMDNLQQVLHDLASGPLAQTDEELTAARKTAEALASDRAKLSAEQAAAREQAAVAKVSQSLPAAAAGEEEVIAAVERLLAGMSGSADFGRFVREIAQLREDQFGHMKSARDAVGLNTLPLERRELNRSQQATIDKAAAGEEALTRRYERTEQGMIALATALRDKDAGVAGRLGDAVDLARQLAIAGSMHQTATDWTDNRAGQALHREQQIADALQQVLDLLRESGGGSSSPAKQLDQLRAAERDLAALQKDLAELRKQIGGAEQQPKAATNDRKLAELRQRQDQLRNRADRLARQLERLQASDAAKSTSQASNKLGGESSGEKKPSSSNDVRQAEQHLAEASRQLAERRRAMEEDIARMMLRQFEVAITAMVERQKIVLADTADAAASAIRQAIAELAAKEHQLADDAHVQSELVHGLSVFVVALEDANKQLAAAAGLLDAGNPGPPTQRAEQLALDRFEQIVAALKQAAAEANNQPPPGGGNNGGGGGGPSKRPTFDLFEVKLLRSLQADLNQRTQDFDKKLSDANAPTTDERAAQEREAAELAEEQGRLAELVKEIANRNNQQQHDE